MCNSRINRHRPLSFSKQLPVFFVVSVKTLGIDLIILSIIPYKGQILNDSVS